MKLRTELVSQIKNIHSKFEESLLPKNTLPHSAILLQIQEDILLKKNTRNNTHIEKILSGLGILNSLVSPDIHKCDFEHLAIFFGKNFEKIKVDIITNSYSSDLHFLPRDDEDSDWSAIQEHSVVLFRYPITVPIEILDLAMDYSIVNWKETMIAESSKFSSATGFRHEKPLKVIKLNPDYLSDLLTRFVGVYVRIGSPDFTEKNIQILKEQII
jgi:hypothetical protein